MSLNKFIFNSLSHRLDQWSVLHYLECISSRANAFHIGLYVVHERKI